MERARFERESSPRMCKLLASPRWAGARRWGAEIWRAALTGSPPKWEQVNDGHSSARSDLAPCRDFSEGRLGDKNSKFFWNEFAWNADIVTITMCLSGGLDFALPYPSF